MSSIAQQEGSQHCNGWEKGREMSLYYELSSFWYDSIHRQ